MYLVVGVVADGVSKALEHGVQKIGLQERHLLNLHVLLRSFALLIENDFPD